MKCIKIINVLTISLAILLPLIAITELIFTFSLVAGFFGLIIMCYMLGQSNYDPDNEYDVRNPDSYYYDPRA